MGWRGEECWHGQVQGHTVAMETKEWRLVCIFMTIKAWFVHIHFLRESDSDEYEENSSDDEAEEENTVEENTSRGTTSDSDSSYDEGCYDGREGSIVYKCKDDEAIANGIPGAKMFDQNIRET